MRPLRHLIAAAGLGIACATTTLGQVDSFPVLRDPPPPPPAFLVVDQDVVFRDSRLGQSIRQRDQDEAAALRDEGRSLDAAFEAEEKALTDQRKEMEPAEFRKLADAFDEKVVATRREQQERANALAQRSEARKRGFLQQLGPVLLEILTETDAAAVVDQRTLLISKGDLNITEEVIKRLDAAYARDNPDDAAATEREN